MEENESLETLAGDAFKMARTVAAIDGDDNLKKEYQKKIGYLEQNKKTNSYEELKKAYEYIINAFKKTESREDVYDEYIKEYTTKLNKLNKNYKQ